MRPRTLLALIAIILFLGLATGFSLTFRLAYVILLALALAALWRLGLLRQTTVHRRVSVGFAQIGESFTDWLTVRNAGWLPQVWIRVEDGGDFPDHNLSAIVSVGSFTEKTWFERVTCRRRGVFRLGPVDLVAGDPFGIYEVRRRALPAREIVVYPRPIELPHFEVPTAALPGEGRHRKPSHQPAPSAFTIRDYVNGDSFNRIHWPSTARLGRLIVKEYELDPVSDVWIVLDGEAAVQAGTGDERTEEYGVTIAVSIAHHFIARNRAVGLIASGSPPVVLPTDRGDRQWGKILQYLALHTAGGTADFGSVLAREGSRFGRTSTLIVITSSTRDTWPVALQPVVQRAVRVAAVVLEAATFGDAPNAILTVGSLAGLGIPTFLVKQDDDLARALSPAQLERGEQAGRTSA